MDGKWFAQKVQMIFQHPALSLNPLLTIAQSLEEPTVSKAALFQRRPYPRSDRSWT